MFKHIFAGRNGTLYAINHAGDLLWFRHLGFADGSNRWAPQSGVKIGTGWGAFKRVMASNNGVIYTISTDGTLSWFKHLGHETGEAAWASGGGASSVGSGWASDPRVVVADDGVLYIVRGNGNLDWYRHTGFDSGAATWSGPQNVGSGWGAFDAIEASSGGVLYCRKQTGQLMWYKHLGAAAGVSSWANPVEIGQGWNLTARFAASNAGVIYILRPNGTLDWYRNDGIDTGTASWRTAVGLVSGFGCLIALRAEGGQYVCAEGGGGQALLANRPAVGPWETFHLSYLDPSRVALQAVNGQYVCAEGGGAQPLTANRPAVDAWETFTLIDRGNGRIALQAVNGQYVCAEGGGGQVLIANRPAIGPWETFTIVAASEDFPAVGTCTNLTWPLGGNGATLVDAKHGKSLVAGDVYDQHVYHQDPQGRANAGWQLEPTSGGWFFIRDRKHGKCLVAGDVYDQHVYHQDPGDRPNARWGLVKAGSKDGVTTYHLIDQKHGKALVAGDVYDQHVYHQDPQGRANAQWTLSPLAASVPAPSVPAPSPPPPSPPPPAWTDVGTPTPSSGDATLDQAIAGWWNEGIEFLDSHVKVRWVGVVTTEQRGQFTVYKGRLEFAAPLSFAVDNVSFTVGKDPTGFFSLYFLKIKLPISVTQLLDTCIHPLLESELRGPLDQLARPGLSGAGELYFILAKGAGRDEELGEIKYGLNLYARTKMSEIEPLATLHRLVPDLGLASRYAVLHVALCRQPLKSLLVELMSQVEIQLGDEHLVLSEITVTGSANLKTATNALAVNCRFRLTVGTEVLILRGSIQVDSKGIVTLWGALDAADGKWEEPFGIPGLVIGGFGVQLAIRSGPPAPSVAGFGARGEVHIGNKLLGGSFAILRDPTQPVRIIPGEIADGKAKTPPPTEPVMMPGEVTLFDSPEGLNLPALLAAFAPPEVASLPLVRSILNLQLTDLNFSRANGPLTIAGQFYNRGWSFRARINLWGYRGLVEGKKSFTGIYLHGALDPLRFQAAGKDVFALTSADGTSGPSCYIDAMLSKQGVSLSGGVALFGGPRTGVEVTIGDGGFEFKVTQEMSGLYAGAMLRFDGRAIRIAQTVIFPYSLEVSGQTVTLSVSTLLTVEASLAGFKQTMSCAFDALGIRREMRLVETTVPFPGLAEVVAAFTQFFDKDVKGIFGLFTWVPHTDSPIIPHMDGPMIPHADAPIIPHGDVSFVPHTDGPIIPHGDVSFVPHADAPIIPHGDVSFVPHVDSPQSGHADAAGIIHGDIPELLHIDTAHSDSHGDWTGHQDFWAARYEHTDSHGDAHGDSGIPHLDTPSVGHADGWAVPHIDSPSTAHLDTSQVLHADSPSAAHVDTAQVLHADTPSTAHVDTATVLHADSPAVLHADVPAQGHMDDPGHWGS